MFILWIACYLLTGFGLSAYNIYCKMVLQYNPIYLLSDLHIVATLIVLLFFFPFLLVIKHYSKLAAMHKLHTVIRIVLVIIFLWLLLSIVFLVYALVNPLQNGG